MKNKVSNVNNKFINFIVKFITVLFVIIIIVLLLGAILFTAKFRSDLWKNYNESVDFVRDNLFLNIILSIVFIAILYYILKILKKANSKTLIIISLVIVGIIGIFWVNYIKVPLRADSKVVYRIALEFLDGSYKSLEVPHYMGMHPMQIGIVYFIELFYKIVKSRNILLFQNFNIFLVVISCFLIYKICQLLYDNEDVNKIVTVLLSLFIVMPMVSVLVYGNIIGLALALFAIYCLLKYLNNRKWGYLIVIPFVITLSIIVKANFEIILIAISIILILDFFKEFKVRNLFIIFLAIILVKISNPLLYKITESKSNIKMSEGTPMVAYIAMGMYEPTDRTAGWYNAEFNVESVYIENNFDVQQTKEASIKVIKDRLNFFKNNPKEFIKYYAEKIGSTWLEPAFQTIWTSQSMEETNEEIEKYYSEQKLIPSILSGKISKVIIKYLDILEIIVFSSSLVYVVYGIRNKKINYKNIILIITFLGGFFFHILWETKSIYALPFYFMLLPSSAAGLNIIFKFIESKLKRKDVKLLERDVD